MKTLILTILLTLSTAQAQTRDMIFVEGDWSPRQDKYLHFGAGVTTYTFLSLCKVNEPAALTFTTIIGASKEIFDSYRTAGTLSDLSYTIAGGISAWLIHRRIKAVRHRRLLIQPKINNNYICVSVTW